MSIPSRAIDRPVAVAMLFVAVVVLGLISFSRLAVDLLPDVAYPRLVIYTTYPDVGPAEVERFVTEPIERRVARVPGVEDVESVSREGVSLVTIRFGWGTDMDFAALNVREQLDQLRGSLPEGAARPGPAVLRLDPRSEPIMAVSVAGDHDLHNIKDLAESVFKRRLEQIDGVAEAAVTGGLDREIQVELDPYLLETYRITIDQVAQAVAAANASAPGGTVLRGRYRFPLRTLGEFERVHEIEDVVVARRDTRPSGAGAGGQAGSAPRPGEGGEAAILLRDIATVQDGFRERQSIARYNGREAVGMLIFKDSEANTVRVSREVDGVLAELRLQYPEVELEVAMSQAGFISDAVSNVVQALVIGGILAFLVLFLFLRDARYPVAIALAIPISVVGTFSLLDMFGVSLNIMSLGGLALGVGMLVDNSIVVLENTFRHRERGLDPIAAAERGANEVKGAITAATLTTISVFLPIIYVEGVAGELFGAVSLAVAFSLAVSLLVALTLLPTMAARWGEMEEDDEMGAVRRRLRAGRVAITGSIGRVLNPPLDAFDAAFRRFAAWYHRVLDSALHHRGRVVALAGLAVVAAVGMGTALDRRVLPEVDHGAFRVRLTLDRGTPLDRTAEATARLEQVLLADPGVDAVFSRIGRQDAVAGLIEDERGIHSALLEVRLVPGARTRQVVERLQPHFATYPPGVLAVETGQVTQLGRLLGGAEADIAVRVRDDDLDRAIAYAERIEAMLAGLPTVRNVRMGTEIGQPELRVRVDREQAATYDIQIGEVVRTVEGYMRGVTATEFMEFDRRIPIVLLLPEEARRSPRTLEILRVRNVPLRELIVAEEALGPTEVQRMGQGRVVPVYADVAGRGVDRALADVEQALAGLEAPRGMRIEIGGENEEMRRSFRDLGFAFALALLLVFMILAAQFESLVHPFTILLSVPLATIGALLALWLSGAGLNTMSLIGMVVLIGIVVNDSIVKVDFINQARARGLALRDAILEAGQARLRPIIMTTVTTVLGLTPLALGVGSGADLRAPLAVAVIGGLITATALTLVVVPVAYHLVESMRQWLRALARRHLGLVASADAYETAGSD